MCQVFPLSPALAPAFTILPVAEGSAGGHHGAATASQSRRQPHTGGRPQPGERGGG